MLSNFSDFVGYLLFAVVVFLISIKWFVAVNKQSRLWIEKHNTQLFLDTEIRFSNIFYSKIVTMKISSMNTEMLQYESK